MERRRGAAPGRFIVAVVLACALVTADAWASPPGAIFLIKGDEDTGRRSTAIYFVWRGDETSPFRRLRGARMEGGVPCISPTGRRLAYIEWPKPNIVVRRIPAAGRRLGRRHRIGRLPFRLTNGLGDCAWSPDESTLVITGWSDTVNRMWTIHRDGTAFRRLRYADHGYPAAQPAWSSTGNLAFLEFRGSAEVPWSVATMDAAGGAVSRLPGHAFAVAWSPDGQQLAFTTASQRVMLADADGRNAHGLEHGGRGVAVGFSPDGQRLAFGYGEQLTITGLDGADPRRIRIRNRPYYNAVALTWARD